MFDFELIRFDNFLTPQNWLYGFRLMFVSVEIKFTLVFIAWYDFEWKVSLAEKNSVARFISSQSFNIVPSVESHATLNIYENFILLLMEQIKWNSFFSPFSFHL